MSRAGLMWEVEVKHQLKANKRTVLWFENKEIGIRQTLQPDFKLDLLKGPTLKSAVEERCLQKKYE